MRLCSLKFYNAMFGINRNGSVISKFCKKRTILHRNYWKMTILWSFSNNSIVKLHGKNFWCHNMTMLYSNSCCNEVC